MKDKNQNSIDPFDEQLRQASGKEHFSFEENAWASLESQLDQIGTARKEPQRNLGKILLICGIIAGGCMLAGFAYYQYSSSDNDTTIGSKPQNLSLSSATYTRVDNTIKLNSINSEEPNQDVIDNSVENSNSSESTINLEHKKVAKQSENSNSNNSRVSLDGLTDNANNSKRVRSSSKDESNFSKNDQELQDRQVNGNQSDKTSVNLNENRPTQQGNGTPEGINPNIKALNQATELYSSSLDKVQLEEIILNSRDLSFIESGALLKEEGLLEIPQEHQEAKNWGTLIQLSAGIQKFSDGPTLFNGNPLVYGFQVGKIYQNAVSFNVGINWFSVSFTANSAQFNTNNTYWPEGIYPSTVDGSVKGIEIPLVVGLHFPQFNGNNLLQFGLEGGLNSVLFSSEKYHFSYDNANPTLTENLEGKWESQNWFQVLHIGLPFKTKISSYANLGITPCANFPMSGLGFGEMTYSTYGIKLNLEIKL